VRSWKDKKQTNEQSKNKKTKNKQINKNTRMRYFLFIRAIDAQHAEHSEVVGLIPQQVGMDTRQQVLRLGVLGMIRKINKTQEIMMKQERT
jgi:hypothetical protein